MRNELILLKFIGWAHDASPYKALVDSTNQTHHFSTSLLVMLEELYHLFFVYLISSVFMNIQNYYYNPFLHYHIVGETSHGWWRVSFLSSAEASHSRDSHKAWFHAWAHSQSVPEPQSSQVPFSINGRLTMRLFLLLIYFALFGCWLYVNCKGVCVSGFQLDPSHLLYIVLFVWIL